MSSEQIINIPGLEIEYLTDSIVVSGKMTYAYREQLKALGGEWSPETKEWFLPPATDMFKIEIIPPPVADSRVLEALKEKERSGNYHWICCESCKVVSWGRGITSCKTHASDGNPIRMFGRIYTGD